MRVQIGIMILLYVFTSDVNDAEPRLLVFDAETRLSFSYSSQTLAKRARAEPRL